MVCQSDDPYHNRFADVTLALVLLLSMVMLSKRELEELRPWVSQAVSKILGFSEDIIVNAALDCVGRSLSRQATAGILFNAHYKDLKVLLN